MKLLDKLKNVFFEEVEEDEEEIPQTFAKKVEIPKKVEIQKKEDVPRKVEPIIREEKNYANDKTEEFTFTKEENKKVVEETVKNVPMMFDDADFLEDDKVMTRESKNNSIYHDQAKEEKELYQGKKEDNWSNDRPAYTYTKTYTEEKEIKGFHPSPIISPIYGILDKNYRKEEVVTKRETRITSSFTKPDLDSVRKKAFGEDEEKDLKDNHKKEEKEEKKIYDVNKSKPQVNSVTLADADEYYNDLGLAYNEDYSDASRNTTTRTSKYASRSGKKENKNDEDDNLFDLIDSMYNKED